MWTNTHLDVVHRVAQDRHQRHLRDASRLRRMPVRERERHRIRPVR